MNKLKQIKALVEEAIEKLRMVGGINPDQRPYCMKILTDLAKKSAEIGDVDQPALQPLPSVDELENELATLWGKDIAMIVRGVAKYLHTKYGTPSNNLQPLPEKMPEWFASYFNGRGNDAVSCYIHCKYTFGTQPREWWMDLKKGDKFIWVSPITKQEHIIKWNGALYYNEIDGWSLGELLEEKVAYFVKDCSPYTDPEAELRKTLNPDQIKLLDEMKEGKK
jgi:hypothetical protein